ncbi:MAG: thiamine diphosphokinase [Parachlamydiaceae bacterium]|nr:thiamine diphosphokinase [Parachlamydiaceae bacterium]
MNSHIQIEQIHLENTPRVALVANGAIHDYSLIAELIRTYARVVAVDGGLFHCHEMGIIPDLLIGDLDSVTPILLSKYSHVTTLRFPTEKDDTDLELAIRAVEAPSIVTIGLFGVMGHRVDHAMNNLNLTCLHSKIIIETETESVFAISGEYQINCFPGQKLSLLPLNSPVIGVTTSGLQWELNHATLNKNFRSISNVCLGKSVNIKIHSGQLICCLARI